MDLGRVLAFLAVDLLLILTPGADWAFLIAAGIGQGPIVAAIAGLTLGYAFHVALVTAGLGPLIAESGVALTALVIAGAAYLIWLGIETRRRTPDLTVASAAGGSRVEALAKGAAVSGLNPKGLLLIFAVLPQFIDPTAAWSPTVQLAVLGIAHLIAITAVYLVLATTARRILRARPGGARRVATVAGTCMIVVAVLLLVERVAA